MNSKVIIYGASDVGQNVRRRLLPFGTDLTMVGTHSRDGIVDQAAAYDMLPSADAVIIALPLTPKTRHLVDKDFLARLPDGAILINASRGGLVDQTALLQELEIGRLQAALDVTAPEPLPAEDRLWGAPGLLLTPHVAGNTDGADDRAWRAARQCILDYLDNTV